MTSRQDLASPWITGTTNVAWAGAGNKAWSVVFSKHKGKKPTLRKVLAVEFLKTDEHDILVFVHPFENESEAQAFIFAVTTTAGRPTRPKISFEDILLETCRQKELLYTKNVTTETLRQMLYS
jgi:hypothetical protein